MGGIHGFSGETLKEERLSYFRSLQRHAAMEYGEVVRSIEALKTGVGDHTPERFADHERHGNAEPRGFAFGPGVMDWKTVKRLYALT